MFDNFLESMQFGKKVKAHGKEWHFVRSARTVVKDDKIEGEYVLAIPYGKEPPCVVTLIFVPSEVENGP